MSSDLVPCTSVSFDSEPNFFFVVEGISGGKERRVFVQRYQHKFFHATV